jgi:hypothetical protein
MNPAPIIGVCEVHKYALTAWQQKKASIVNQGANAPSLFAISGIRRNTLKNSVAFI